MARSLLALLVAFAFIAPLRAESGPVELWNGLRFGMSRDEVKQRHPGRKVFLNAHCRARFKPVFDAEKLQLVRLVQYINYNDCGIELYNALVRKYGPPEGRGSIGYIDFTGIGSSHDFYWYAKGRSIKLRLLENGRFSEIAYSPGFEGMAHL